MEYPKKTYSFEKRIMNKYPLSTVIVMKCVHINGPPCMVETYTWNVNSTLEAFPVTEVYTLQFGRIKLKVTYFDVDILGKTAISPI